MAFDVNVESKTPPCHMFPMAHSIGSLSVTIYHLS